MFVHEFHLGAAERNRRTRGERWGRGWGAVLTKGFWETVTVFLVHHDIGRKGDAGKLADFQCLSLTLTGSCFRTVHKVFFFRLLKRCNALR